MESFKYPGIDINNYNNNYEEIRLRVKAKNKYYFVL